MLLTSNLLEERSVGPEVLERPEEKERLRLWLLGALALLPLVAMVLLWMLGAIVLLLGAMTLLLKAIALLKYLGSFFTLSPRAREEWLGDLHEYHKFLLDKGYRKSGAQ